MSSTPKNKIHLDYGNHTFALSKPARPNFELSMLTKLTRTFPNIPGFGRFADLISSIYNRREREPVLTEHGKSTFYVEPGECVDSKVLFYPQLYDALEMNHLKSVLAEGDTFIDIGANIGFYTIQAAKFVGETGRVIAIEADPYNYRKLLKNVSINSLTNVLAINCGVSDKKEQLRLALNTEGNRGGNSFLRESEKYEVVECRPLLEILNEAGVDSISAMKLDIEGFEFRVLNEFLNTVDSSLLPPHILFEDWAEELETQNRTPNLLLEFDYKISHIKDENFVGTRQIDN